SAASPRVASKGVYAGGGSIAEGKGGCKVGDAVKSLAGSSSGFRLRSSSCEPLELAVVDRHDVLGCRIGACRHVGDELAEGGDPFLLEALKFRGEVAVGLGVARLVA